ncbi:hypothetical protein D9M68_839070 [compost metagenome]
MCASNSSNRLLPFHSPLTSRSWERDSAIIRSITCRANSSLSVARVLVSRTMATITANWFFTRWLTSRIKALMRSSLSFCAVMSRATLDTPIISPLSPRIGEIVSEIGRRRPSLCSRTVSK